MEMTREQFVALFEAIAGRRGACAARAVWPVVNGTPYHGHLNVNGLIDVARIVGGVIDALEAEAAEARR